MNVGQRYRIRYRLDNQRYDREAVLDYIGQNEYGEDLFSARPIAGTQSFPKGSIKHFVRFDGHIAIDRRAQ